LDTLVVLLLCLQRIDFAFPLATLPLAHAVFTEQLLLSRAQATAWIDAIEPLYEILTAAGMGTDDAWERVLIFCKAVFDDIRTVRAITLDTKNTAGMIWGSVQNEIGQTRGRSLPLVLGV